MCGYCTERAVLAQRMSAPETRAAAHVDPLLLPVHLQEARDWRRAWMEVQAQDDLVALLILLCRAWSDRVAGVGGAPLRDLLHPASHARLRDWLASLAWPAGWDWLRDDRGPLPQIPPLQAARDELDAYTAGWLQLGGPAASRWDEARLHERLPCVSMALDLLLHAAPGDIRILTLALSSPGVASPFSAIDLWLQRRAVRALLAPCGTHLALLARLRSDAVLAAVVYGDLDDAGLRAVQATLCQGAVQATEGVRDLRTVLARLLAPTGIDPS